MYVLATNMWFSSLMRQFFFWIDKIVFNFISAIYNVLIAIARTSVFTQSDFAELSDRIYKLLAVFMVFKVTLSLITYVVNPDNFTEKSKGVYKLSTNIIISLAMLILTPYIFSYAYEVQTILLEDNSLGVLILGGDDNNANDSVFNTAGDKIAYTAMTPFFSPNVSLVSNCTTLLTGEAGNKVFNSKCSGITDGSTNEDGTLYGLTVDNEKHFSEQTLKTYVAGVEKGNLGLMFRQDMALATANDNTEFVMDYKFLFSTATGIIIILLLVTFCMDVGVRSIKLAFLQLIAPVPIISYIDPKKGKDGMFKKWGEMCFKTYLSLFIRLIALYFAVFIIEKISDGQLVDVVDGSYITNPIIYVFIIIGALMFAKQLPKILEGLGIKLDGDGKFSLNPLKKMEDNMIGGKSVRKAAKLAARPVKGLATAGLVGGAALVTRQGFRGGMTAMKGAMKGEKFGKNFSKSYSAARARKKEVQQMELDGVSPWKVRMENLKNTVRGGATAKDEYDTFKSDLDMVTNGYKKYLSTVLAADKVAKEFERRRVAAENAGNDAEAKLWQDSIDNRLKSITKNGNKVALEDRNNVAFETAERMLDAFNHAAPGQKYSAATYGNAGNNFEQTSNGQFDSRDIVANDGLINTQQEIEIGINELNEKFKGRFSYKGDLDINDSLKVINGKAKNITTAAESSPEKREIDSIYKYVNKKSNK